MKLNLNLNLVYYNYDNALDDIANQLLYWTKELWKNAEKTQMPENMEK